MIRTVCTLLLVSASALADTEIRLAENPALSPDGRTLLFSWRGDIWKAPSVGGVATRLTVHPAPDFTPRFSPDGKTIAFVSDRTGSRQLFTMTANGRDVTQRTLHTEGAWLQDWAPSGNELLIISPRDHFWYRSYRYFFKSLDMDSAPRLVFNAQGRDGARLAPDGRTIAFRREGVAWWRKGYRGPRAGQIWLYDIEKQTFRMLTSHDRGERSPLWAPDSRLLYLVSQEDGTHNLWRVDTSSGEREQMTRYQDDGVHFPAISADGSTIVFRRLFDLYRLEPQGGKPPQKITLRLGGDVVFDATGRTLLRKATQAAFSADGREIALVAGGDIWVMDTELKEPRRVTNTPGAERDPVFSPDFNTLVFVSDADLWKATRADPRRYWWQNTEFKLEQLTNDPAPEARPRFSPDGKRVFFISLRGDLRSLKLDGTDPKLIFESWNRPDYDISPDGKWIAYALSDTDDNRDVHVRPADGTGEAVNVSRHPDAEWNPVWSPDGKMLAFLGRRSQNESDVHFVWLRKKDHEASKRDRTVQKAVKKMKERKKEQEGERKGEEKKKKKEKKKKVEVVIDFDRIEERVHRVPVPGSDESQLMWSPDSKKLAFVAKIGPKKALHTVEVPDDLEPKRMSTQTGKDGRWLKEGNQIVWLQDGVPASVPAKGKAQRYGFRAPHEIVLRDRHRAAFDLVWRTMRDRFYDERMGNRDWNAIRAKYAGGASQCLTPQELRTVVRLMLGELNGSHLGFTVTEPGPWTGPAWRDTTFHLGARFDPAFEGPGLRVRDVVQGTPADNVKSRISPGEIVVRIDGKTVGPKLNLATVTTGVPARDVTVTVKDKDGKERDVVLRPTTFAAVRRLLYEQWVERTRALVDALSGSTLGYLHVRGMNWPSFERFEAELYKVGHGKDGLVIDVRENGGGFTTDHLLTCLTQPSHAVTVSRGGGPGYPQGRMVYARWDKPIVVLCNQNSFSNAEIFSHAIKALKRGKLVGVRTAGGVISTSGTDIMGFARLRVPMRGWFVKDTGQDMELNGCAPDVTLWPQPGAIPAGEDKQLETAVKLLLDDVQALEKSARPKLTKASEREK